MRKLLLFVALVIQSVSATSLDALSCDFDHGFEACGFVVNDWPQAGQLISKSYDDAVAWPASDNRSGQYAMLQGYIAGIQSQSVLLEGDYCFSIDYFAHG